MRIFVISGLVLMTTGGLVSAGDLESYGDPAIIAFSADLAKAERDSSGETVITFYEVSKLSSLATRLHKINERTFSAFPTSELPVAWNSCNDMKFSEDLFHSDGVNSAITFSNGPADEGESGHVNTAPLVTQSKTISETKGGGEGTLHAMLVNASFNENTLTFSVLGAEGNIGIGAEYQEVVVITECSAPTALPQPVSTSEN